MTRTMTAVGDEGEPPRPGQAVAERVGGLLLQAARHVPTRKLALSLGDQAVASGTTFATAVIIGRGASPDVLGLYFLAWNVLLFARGIQEHVVSAPYIVYSHRRTTEALSAYTGSTLVFQAVLSVLCLVALLGLTGASALGFGPQGLLAALGVLLIGTPFILLREYIRTLAFARLQPGRALAVDGTVAVLQLGGLLLLAATGGLSVATVYTTLGVAAAAACALWFVVLAPPLRILPSDLARDWHENWAFGRWALATHLLSGSAPYFLPWLLVFTHGEAETGRLAACASLVGVANLFIASMSNYVMPLSARTYVQQGAAGLRRILRRATALFALSLGALCIVFAVAGEFLTRFVYGNRYQDTAAILTLLAAAMFANSLGMTAGIGLWALNQPRRNLPADVSGLMATLAFAFALVPAWGVLGVAVATFGGTVVGAVVRWDMLRRQSEMRLPRGTSR